MTEKIYELMDQVFHDQEVKDAEETAMPFVLSQRIDDRVMLSKVPLLGTMTAQTFIAANDRGVYFVAYYPRQGIIDEKTLWRWQNIHYAKWKNGRRFALELEQKDKRIAFTSFQKDKKRAMHLESLLSNHFDENGKNRAMLYPGDPESETTKGMSKAPKDYEKLTKKRKRRQTFNQVRAVLAVIVVSAMLIYIVGKGFLGWF